MLSKTIIFGTERSLNSLAIEELLPDCKIWIRKSGYPTTQEISNIIKFIEESKFEFNNVVAIGGGSTLDASKVVAAQIFRNQSSVNLSLIPTNIGSGAEITSFATLWDFAAGKKLSERLPAGLKRAVHYDASLFSGIPKVNAIVGALDALSHAYDSLFSSAANEDSKEMAIIAIRDLNDLLASGFEEWPKEMLISRFQNAAMLSAFCIETTKTSLSHGLSYGLTLHLGLPHGVAVGIVLREYLDSYFKLLSKEIHESIVSCSIVAVSSALKEVAQEEYLGLLTNQIQQSIDWERVNNFLPIRNHESHLEVLERAMSGKSWR